MTFSDVFLPVPFLVSPFDLHRLVGVRNLKSPAISDLRFGVLSDKHRAREPRSFTHELSHESAHENADGSVHEDVHRNAHEG